ncbi:MAG: hypothetical protein ISR60_03525 [Anaerolineales bacterium]|nr:hypothetical protein [Anaerolineales bacterium]
MNSRQRFLDTFGIGAKPDRVPLLGEGMRPEVFATWGQPGLAALEDITKRFLFDEREEIVLEVEPDPEPERWPATLFDLEDYRRHLNPDDPHRLPRLNPAWEQRRHPLLLRVNEGFFLNMGVYKWERFYDLMNLCTDQPDFVRAMMKMQGEFVAELTARFLRQSTVDAVIFSEPIGGNHGPLISPHMYADYVLPSYRPALEVIARHGIETVILRTYANTRALLPAAVDCGFNCLWACETDERDMDYLDIRQEFGPELGLIGGLDTDVLMLDQAAIRREVERVVPPLLAQGNFIPLLDGRVREYIPYENYAYYRELLAEIVTQ